MQNNNEQPICHINEKATKYWYLNGVVHNEDGPAIESVDGHKEWWVNGNRHRENGPAVERVDGSKEWWVNDMLIMFNHERIYFFHNEIIKHKLFMFNNIYLLNKEVK